MKNLYETLEMISIQNQVKQFCASSLGKKKIDDVHVFDDIEDLELALSQVKEAMESINQQGPLSLGGFYDISLLIEKAKRDGVLLGNELLQISLQIECVIHVQNYFSSSEIEYQSLRDLKDGLECPHHVYDEIQRCILPDGSMNDHASQDLFITRRNIEKIQTRIRQKMESYVKNSQDMLSLDNMTTKNDRFVLPVKSGYKSHFDGLVHAHSATGQTLYIEPQEVVLMNNELDDLRIIEKEEVNRILYQLSQLVKKYYYQFFYNLEILAELDFIFSKAMYGYQHHCCIPAIGQTKNIYLKEARHPLIDDKKVVANDIIMDGHKMLLISGSNTGGKTVALKTIGLLSMMALCGFPVTCLEMNIPMFDDIYVDLGDEQSIEQSLSTFSSHMKRIIDIIHQSTDRSLIILDELGSGTDPQEGQCLAQAILSYLLEKECYVFASTHFGKLKTFAKENPKILLASVSFDLELMKPTYRLLLDSISPSYAIEIAELLGLDHHIITHAQYLKEESLSEHEKLMEQLSKKEEELIMKEEKLNHLMSENDELHKKYQKQMNHLEHQKQMIVHQAKVEANQIIDQAKKDIQVVMKRINEQTLKPHEIIQAKHDLEGLTYVEDNQRPKQEHILKVGDRVKILKMNREGDIIDILNQHMILVSVSGLSVKLHEDEVAFLHSQLKPKKVKKAGLSKSKVKKIGTYEINVIGKRYEEAMELVDKFLDDALVLGYPHVRIVHGMGTGVLRKGIRKMLDKNKNVVSYRDGGPNEGGLGATLVYFE